VEHEDGAQDVGEGCDPVEEVNWEFYPGHKMMEAPS
jgi:hypothetical protein